MIKNLLHNIPAGKNPPEEIYVVVENPKGGKNKYEYDEELGVIKLDRVIYGTNCWPTDYGFIPQTWNPEDGDPLDVMILSTNGTFPGCVVAARPLGLIKLMDTGEKDDKIIAAPADDPRFDHLKSIDDLPDHHKKELTNFWETYVLLQPNKDIEVIGWGSAKEAKEMIKKAIEEYKRKFPE